MAHQSKALVLALPMLALWSCAGMAMAANPLGFAVAAAPSMFVLAVAQADAERVEGKQAKAEATPRPRQEALAADTARTAPPVAPAAPPEQADGPRISLR